MYKLMSKINKLMDNSFLFKDIYAYNIISIFIYIQYIYNENIETRKILLTATTASDGIIPITIRVRTTISS